MVIDAIPEERASSRQQRVVYDTQYTVEQILATKKMGCGKSTKLYFLVKWKNRDEQNWVEYCQLDCNDEIAQYEAKKWLRCTTVCGFLVKSAQQKLGYEPDLLCRIFGLISITN